MVRHHERPDEKLLGAWEFRIRPEKGQFVLFDKAAGKLLKTIILPVPGKRTKGIVVCPTIFGNVLVGPTAEAQRQFLLREGCDEAQGFLFSPPIPAEELEWMFAARQEGDALPAE